MYVFEKLSRDEEIVIGDLISIQDGKAYRSVYNEEHKYEQIVIGVCIDIKIENDEEKIVVMPCGTIKTLYIGELVNNMPVTISDDAGKVRSAVNVPEEERENMKIYGYVLSVLDEKTAMIRLEL